MNLNGRLNRLEERYGADGGCPACQQPRVVFAPLMPGTAESERDEPAPQCERCGGPLSLILYRPIQARMPEGKDDGHE